MQRDKHITKVIFRKFNGGEVLALFPEIPATVNGWLCSSYMHVGQHSAADPACVQFTKPASPREYASLARELRRIGYRLKIVKRFPKNAFDTRKRNL